MGVELIHEGMGAFGQQVVELRMIIELGLLMLLVLRGSFHSGL